MHRRLKIFVFVGIQSQHFQDYRRHVDQEEIRRLQELVKSQAQLSDVYRREISLLSSKGGHVLPPGKALLPPLASLATSKDKTNE